MVDSCMCAPNWKGIHCNRRTVDCLSSPAAELCGHGTCVQTNDAIGFSCICEQGWKTNDVTVACTVDVDECADSKPHCSMEPEVRCINLPGTYMCGWCPTGYTGNGHYCSDVNECETNNGGCSTNPTVQCVNTRVSSNTCYVVIQHNCCYFRDPVIAAFVLRGTKATDEHAIEYRRLRSFLDQATKWPLVPVQFLVFAIHWLVVL